LSTIKYDIIERGAQVMQNTVAEDDFIMSPKNDYVFKRIFGDARNKDILVSFLNAVLEEKINDVELLNTELKKEHAQDKHGILDVKAKTDQGLFVDIEIQLWNVASLHKRTLYYWSKMYIEQMAPGETYCSLMKTITINIVDYNCIENEYTHNVFHVRERKTNIVLTDVLEIHFLELTKLTEDKNINEAGLLEWLMFLKSDTKEVFDVLAKKNKEINKAYDLLKKMSANKKERYLYEERQAAIHDEATRVKESFEKGWDGGKEEGLELGHELGREQGIEQGIGEGIEQEREKNIKKMKKKGMTDEEISEMLEINIEIVKAILR